MHAQGLKRSGCGQANPFRTRISVHNGIENAIWKRICADEDPVKTEPIKLSRFVIGFVR
jgi:hypothetical protein